MPQKLTYSVIYSTSGLTNMWENLLNLMFRLFLAKIKHILFLLGQKAVKLL
nr:MAG TPA: hypothetical protein [Caudoviricetes sp.]